LPPSQEKEAFEILQLHAASALAVARAAARILIPKHRGHLLFFSSLAAIRPNPGQAAYAAGKGAIESLVRALAREWGSKNIRVNAIAPGYIDSKAVQEMNDSLREAKLNHLPAGRLGYPEEVAALASFLSSPRAAYITGQVLRIDGGASI
jgi:3-oxoacyl-[acyl-carrier protein] reductase